MHNQIISETTEFGKFNVVTINKDSQTAQFLSAKPKYVAILPFDRNSENGIKSMYLLQTPNRSINSPVHTLIVDEIDADRDRTPYDSVCRALIEEAGLDLEAVGLNEDNVFFLGEISTNIPVTSVFACYAIDITAKSSIEFTRNLSKDSISKDESSITRVGFHEVVNGNFTDSLVLSASFLLVSYFN